MPTLVRNRGKAGNLKAVQARLRNRKMAKRQRTQSPPRRAPNLDTLPTELIQDIFCYGTNPQLPLASSGLHSQLTGEQVRRRLVLRVFHHHIQDLAREDASGPALEDLGDIQSAVLRQTWLTHDFFRQCRWNCFLGAIRRDVLAICAGDQQGAATEALRSAELNLKKLFAEKLSLVEHPVVNIRYGTTILWITLGHRSSELRLTFYQQEERSRPSGDHSSDDEDDPLEAVAINTETFAVDDDRNVRGKLLRSTTVTFPCLTSTCDIPSRLLRGPWTHGQASLLLALLVSLDRWPGPRTTALRDMSLVSFSLGLDSAIRERCRPAVNLLMRHGDRCSEVARYARRPHRRRPAAAGGGPHAATSRPEETAAQVAGDAPPWRDPDDHLPWTADAYLNDHFWVFGELQWPRLVAGLGQIELFVRTIQRSYPEEQEFFDLLLSPLLVEHSQMELEGLLMQLEDEYRANSEQTAVIGELRQHLQRIFDEVSIFQQKYASTMGGSWAAELQT